jgi:hypothetical protein
VLATRNLKADHEDLRKAGEERGLWDRHRVEGRPQEEVVVKLRRWGDTTLDTPRAMVVVASSIPAAEDHHHNRDHLR